MAVFKVAIALFLTVFLLPAGHVLAQKPIAVRIDAIDLDANSITIAFRDTPRTLPMAATVRVAVDEQEAAVADIRPGDSATVVYDKAAHAIVSADVWRNKPADARQQLLADGGFELISDAANLLRWERQKVLNCSGCSWTK